MYLKCKEVFTESLSKEYNFVPISEDSNCITCLIANNSLENMDLINALSDKNIIFKKVELSDVISQQNKIYKKTYLELLRNEAYELNKNRASDIAIVNYINYIIAYAISINSSDIHIEGLEDSVQIRIRIDGILKVISRINKNYHQNIISRIKVLSNLDYTVKNIPQDSRFTFKYKDKNIDIRVATTPTVNGEKIVLRILNKKSIEYTSTGIGLKDNNLKKIKLLLQQPQGLILSVGPTGCGKSSTIYTLLKTLQNSEKNIITIEDPVEYKIEGINQINIDEEAGLDFERGLEAILRLDPDILMIGEIRNSNTANTAIRASITGRIVFSTVHTSDCPSTILRLADMGIENYLISAGLIGIISQRLVRKLCTCKKKVNKYVELYNETIEYYEPVGCEKCIDGYNGRTAIFEILILNKNIKEAINNKANLETLTEIAIDNGLIPLKNSMKEALEEGITSLDEIYRNIMTI